MENRGTRREGRAVYMLGKRREAVPAHLGGRHLDPDNTIKFERDD